MAAPVDTGSVLERIEAQGRRLYPVPGDTLVQAPAPVVLALPRDSAVRDSFPLVPGRQLLRTWGRDRLALLTSPQRFDERDWNTVGLVLAAEGVLLVADRDLRGFALDHRSGVVGTGARVVREAGNGFYSLPFLGLLYAKGAWSHEDRDRKAALLAFDSFLAANVVTQSVKRVVSRVRPSQGADPLRFGEYSLGDKSNSFPSGHSTAAWSVLASLAMSYRESGWVPWVAYGLATATAASRVYDNQHWSSDVVAGSLIGYFSARALHRLHGDAPAFQIVPVAGIDGSAGLATTLRF